MPLLSLVIITQNAVHDLARCLIAAQGVVDEIMIVDSGSTDQTVAIAKSYHARVLEAPWRGFGPQKQFAVTMAKHDWVLCLDADEVLTDILQKAIITTMQAPRYHAYQLRRANQFLGRSLRHGEGYPDLSLRLFHRQYAKWSDDLIHEYVQTAMPHGQLDGDLLHYSAQNLSSYFVKQNHYTDLQAKQLWQKRKKADYGALFISPLFRFIKFYLLKQGFRDGLPGFIHIAVGCINSFMKYAKLIELAIRNKES
jgi:glycosyltransferase involved in cell wall biosynthesis